MKYDLVFTKTIYFTWIKSLLVEIQLTHFMTIKVYIASIVRRQARPNYKSHQNLNKKHYFNVIKTLYLLKTMEFTWFKGISVEIQLISVVKINIFSRSIVQRLVRTNFKCHQNLKNHSISM